MTLQERLDTFFQGGNFDVDFKNLIAFALTIWESAKPVSYFEGSKV